MFSYHDFGIFLVCADDGVAAELVALNVLRVDVIDKGNEFRVSLVLLDLFQEFLDRLLGATGHGHHRRVGQQGGGGGFRLRVRLQNDVRVGTAESERVDGDVATREWSVLTNNLRQKFINQI